MAPNTIWRTGSGIERTVSSVVRAVRVSARGAGAIGAAIHGAEHTA
jgi:hypothetical protein